MRLSNPSAIVELLVELDLATARRSKRPATFAAMLAGASHRALVDEIDDKQNMTLNAISKLIWNK